MKNKIMMLCFSHTQMQFHAMMQNNSLHKNIAYNNSSNKIVKK